MTRPSSNSVDALYISYDGVLEPIGQSQVLPYLFSLADTGFRLQLISFEKPVDVKDEITVGGLRRLLADHNIRWTRLSYHRRPRLLSTVFDVAIGTWIATWQVLSTRAKVVHARSYVPALMALVVKSLTGARFIFDMRGFWPEERVDLGIFRENGYLFRISKWFEKNFLRNSDQVVVLTNRAKKILENSRHLQQPADSVKVIPCCVDLARFPRREPNLVITNKHGLKGRFVIGNMGAVSGRYLVHEMFRFVVQLREYVPELRFVYLTYQNPELLFSIAKKEGLSRDCLVVAKATPEEVPEWLSIFHYAIFFPKPSYSAQAMCPTKLGELLAAGLPVVTNAGVGDVEEIVQKEGVGTVLKGLSDDEISEAASNVAKAIPVSSQIRRACRQAAMKHFDLVTGCAQYDSIYRSLLQ